MLVGWGRSGSICGGRYEAAAIEARFSSSWHHGWSVGVGRSVEVGCFRTIRGGVACRSWGSGSLQTAALLLRVGVSRRTRVVCSKTVVIRDGTASSP